MERGATSSSCTTTTMEMLEGVEISDTRIKVVRVIEVIWKRQKFRETTPTTQVGGLTLICGVEIWVVVTRGGGRKSDMLMVIKERGTLDISYREIKAPGGWAWVDHLIASIVIEMDISRHPTPTLLSAITVKKMGTMPWHARPRKDST
jgi:hypothetical protein